MGDVFIEFSGPRVFLRRIIVHSVIDGPLNPYFLGKRVSITNPNFSVAKKRLFSRFS